MASRVSRHPRLATTFFADRADNADVVMHRPVGGANLDGPDEHTFIITIRPGLPLDICVNTRQHGRFAGHPCQPVTTTMFAEHPSFEFGKQGLTEKLPPTLVKHGTCLLPSRGGGAVHALSMSLQA